ncbi:Flp family type IVb pilin [Cedecea sp.]|jgi:pilus assembly protein Flp/PilA|uniref:Flp family type IVb pilin n=1 Tax=Cedecea sp. TaxID=1970739 RepID=UPI0012ADE9C1|nr:Flp family type IVb pilin [Enterobacteriaceae bacterium RIT693]
MKNFMIKSHVNCMLRFEQFCKDQKGVTAIEYALIGVAMATLLAFILGDQDSGFLGALKETFDKIAEAISSVTISGSGS